MQSIQGIIKLLVLQVEIDANASQSGVLVVSLNLSPKGPGRVKLVAQEERYYRVYFHKRLLLMRKQRVLSKLGLNALRELLPVEVADEPFELRFV